MLDLTAIYQMDQPRIDYQSNNQINHHNQNLSKICYKYSPLPKRTIVEIISTSWKFQIYTREFVWTRQDENDSWDEIDDFFYRHLEIPSKEPGSDKDDGVETNQIESTTAQTTANNAILIRITMKQIAQFSKLVTMTITYNNYPIHYQ